jgi:hypothetical protein
MNEQEALSVFQSLLNDVDSYFGSQPTDNVPLPLQGKIKFALTMARRNNISPNPAVVRKFERDFHKLSFTALILKLKGMV